MSFAVLLRPSCRGLQRLLPSLWQTESQTWCVRSSVQPLATWTERVKRWSSGDQSGKEPCTASSDTEFTTSEGDTPAELPSQSQPTEQPSTAEQQESKDDIELLLTEKDEKIKDFQDKYLRALAEIDNIQKRSRKQVEAAKLYGIQGFSKDILDVADILQKATGSVPETALQDRDNQHLIALYDGVILTEAELQKVLMKNGVHQINPLGQMFDPAFHEAMFEVEGEKPGTIAHVTTLGYTLHGRTIRPARVGVVKQPDTHE